MRNKIKQLLNKEEGFTLVELLAVLAILALIVGIAVPMIGNVISGSEGKATTAQEELIIDAAMLYEVQEKQVPTTAKELVEAGYLESDKSFTDEVKITKEVINGKNSSYKVTGLKGTTENK